jgi:hypothetical protein
MGKRPLPVQAPKIIDVKIEKVELHQTENAWRPAKFNDASSEAETKVAKFVFFLFVDRRYRSRGFRRNG